MKIVIIGGTGLIGSKTVHALQARGHEVWGVAPSTGVDTYTGEGLAEALAGAEVVIDLANSPSFEDGPAMDFFQTAGRNLLAAGKAAGIRHHIALSVVGTGKLLASGYFRAKEAQEELIRASGLPYTIIHSTQFMEFVGAIARSATHDDEVRLSPAQLQPILSDDVAAAVADVAEGAPVNGVVEIAGPDRAPMTSFVSRVLAAAGDPRRVLADPAAAYFGVVLNDTDLVPEGSARLAPNGFDAYLGRGEFRL